MVTTNAAVKMPETPRSKTIVETSVAMRPAKAAWSVVVERKQTLDQRILGALAVLWSLAKPGEPKAIVARLYRDCEERADKPRVSDRMLQHVASAQANVRAMKAISVPPNMVSRLIRLEANLEGILTEVAG